MSKHTAGPWEYSTAMNHVGFSIAPVGTLPTLASVERPKGNRETVNVQCFNFPGETEANARLISPSPDLLEALERMADASPFYSDAEVCECGPNGDGRDEDGNICEHIQARRAIAKARG